MATQHSPPSGTCQHRTVKKLCGGDTYWEGGSQEKNKQASELQNADRAHGIVPGTPHATPDTLDGLLATLGLILTVATVTFIWPHAVATTVITFAIYIVRLRLFCSFVLFLVYISLVYLQYN